MLTTLTLTALCPPIDSKPAIDVLEARNSFNQAIVDQRIEPIRRVLGPNVILVTGTDSELIIGRDAQIAIWASDFDNEHRLIYKRTARCINPSPLLPIALETGVWHGAVSPDSNNYVSGEYSAKWRMIDDVWQLEAEIYLTTGCGGDLCPQVSPEP